MHNTESIIERDGLKVGDTVRVPGHGRKDPATVGTLVEIFAIDFPRSGRGFFVKVQDGDRLIRCAFGLCRKVEA